MQHGAGYSQKISTTAADELELEREFFASQLSRIAEALPPDGHPLGKDPLLRRNNTARTVVVRGAEAARCTYLRRQHRPTVASASVALVALRFVGRRTARKALSSKGYSEFSASVRQCIPLRALSYAIPTTPLYSSYPYRKGMH